MTTSYPRTGEIWEFDIRPIGFRVYYILGLTSESSHYWNALVLYDEVENLSGSVELLSAEEISGDLFYWTQLL